MQTVAKIDNVSSRTTATGKTVFKVEAEGKTYATMKEQTAKEAQALVGQNVVLEYAEREARNAGYPPDLWLNEVSPTGVADVAAPKPGNGAVPETSVQPVTARDMQIHRQTASKVAAELLRYFLATEQTLETFDNLTQALVRFYQTGQAISLASQPIGVQGEFGF